MSYAHKFKRVTTTPSSLTPSGFEQSGASKTRQGFSEAKWIRRKLRTEGLTLHKIT